MHWTAIVAAVFIVSNLAGVLFPALLPGSSTAAYLATASAAVVLLGGSIVAHEFGHALTGRARGQRVDGITLWLLGGVARLEGEPRTPRHAAEVAAAGPAVSLVLATVGLVVAGALSLLGGTGLLVALAFYLGLLNAGLALFNLLPVFPLDGGRILQAWFWHRTGDTDTATIRAAEIGRRGGWAMAALGALLAIGGQAGVSLMLVGGFVVLQARAERQRAQRRIALRSATRHPLFAFFEMFGQAVPARRVATADATIIDTTARRRPD